MKHNSKQALLDRHGPQKIIERLAPYLTTPRQQRIEQVISGRLSGIELAIEAPADINNALAAVRTSEALGISQMHIITPEGDTTGIRGITQGAFHWIRVHCYEQFEQFVAYVKQNQLQLAGGVANATTAVSQVPIDNRLCLLLGNEQRGLSEQATAACDLLYRIPMYGMSESLNLSVSAAISLYDITTRKRLALQQTSDLSEQEIQTTRAYFYLNSVKARSIHALLAK